jgi:prevent-host-death family protein
MATIRVGAEQLRRQLTDLLNRVGYGGDEVIVERNGRPLVILQSYTGAEAVARRLEADVEKIPALASELEAARIAAGVSYEELARQLRVERLRTLREKYPDFAAQYAQELEEELSDATSAKST